MNTTKPAGDIRISICHVSAEMPKVKTAFEMMMSSHRNAMTSPATSEQRWEYSLLANSRKVFLVEDLENMISELQAIKASVENLWN